MITPERWMRHQAQIFPWKGQGLSAPEYGEPFSSKCLLSLGRKLGWRQRINSTQEVLGKGKAYFPAGTPLHPNDRLEIQGQRYMALSVQPRYNPDGTVNHIEVIVQ